MLLRRKLCLFLTEVFASNLLGIKSSSIVIAGCVKPTLLDSKEKEKGARN